ncbi:FeoB-associated Cys-rich membrane protein [uncultured Clostridium sp.]|uniref:FeoB-associated Cys-rich membrane protein n=1 Tax=uncultured Clostridium sp. TaxID=59620 RepID=UPI0025D8B60A|nr:FeoB-associated Cys-rich membrane protein [uncultured Clostridium sp.]
MGTFITAVVLIAIISLIVRSMIHDKKNGKSLQCGIGCKNCGGHCHNTTLQIKKEDKK